MTLNKSVAAYGRSLLPRFARQLTSSRGRRVRHEEQAHAGANSTGRYMGAAASDYRPRSLPPLRGQIYLPLLSLRSGTEESAVASPPPRAFFGCRPNKQHTITKHLHAVVALVLLRGSVPPYVAPSLPSAAPHRGRRGRRGRLPSNGRRGRRGRLVSSLPVAPLLSPL